MSNATTEFTLNPHCLITVNMVGEGEIPIVIIDNFLRDGGERARQLALQANFQTDGKHLYPGVRADLPKHYVMTCLHAVYDKLYDIYAIPDHLRVRVKQNCYSLISTNEQDLHAQQLIPHYDTPRKYFFAILHYLSLGEHGGTGLFRHRESQYERIDEQREVNYLPLSSAYTKVLAKNGKKYFTATDKQYTLYHSIDYQPNRLVIYPGNLIHSTLVNTKQDVNDNPASGRLTGNIFIEYE